MEGSEGLIVLLIAAVISGGIGAAIASTDRESVGFGLGFFLGPIGWIIAAILRLEKRPGDAGVPEAQRTKKCPDCAETILYAARKCRFCGADVSTPTSTTGQPWR